MSHKDSLLFYKCASIQVYIYIGLKSLSFYIRYGFLVATMPPTIYILTAVIINGGVYFTERNGNGTHILEVNVYIHTLAK